MTTSTTSSGRAGQLYERDLYAWCLEQASRLRERTQPGTNDGLDYENLAEEIEALGKSQRSALRSHMIVLLKHLLKWRHQPGRPGSSWERSIFNARSDIAFLLGDSPSLRGQIAETIEQAYPRAVREAEYETKIARRNFPTGCPFSEAEVLDPEFLPTDLDTLAGG